MGADCVDHQPTPWPTEPSPQFRNAVENLLKVGQQDTQHSAPHAAHPPGAPLQPQASRPWDGELSHHASTGLRMALPAHLAAIKPGDVKSPPGGLTVAQLMVTPPPAPPCACPSPPPPAAFLAGGALSRF